MASVVTDTDAGAPPYAALCWADARSLYVQLPGPAGPVVIPFDLASGGLSKALPLLQRHFKETPRPISIPTQAHDPHKARVNEILRKMRIIP